MWSGDMLCLLLREEDVFFWEKDSKRLRARKSASRGAPGVPWWAFSLKGFKILLNRVLDV